MDMEIFAVKDRQLDAYMNPWVAQSVGQAIRMFTDEVNNKEGQINKHAGDYDLYHIGTFANQMGELAQSQEQPKLVSIGANVKEK